MRFNHVFALVPTAALVVTLAASSGCSSSPQDASPDQQWALVQNHFFIDHMPRNERDMTGQIAFVDDDGNKIGVRGHSSRFRIFLDFFTWNRRGSDVNTVILQTNDKVSVRFKAWSCSEGRFELCMELRAGDKVRKYYSRKDWIIEDAAHTDALLEKIGVDETAAPAAAADDFPL